MSAALLGDLPRWRAKLAAARYARADIVVLGDSISEGAYSNDAGTSDPATWRVRGWVGQLRSLFADRYGDPGEGAIWMGDDGASRISATGATKITNSGALGPFKTYYTLAGNSQVVTVNLPVCTTIRIHSWWVQGTTGAVEYEVDDSGSFTAITGGSGSDTLYSFDITGLADTTHKLEVRGPSSGTGYLIAVEAIRQDAGVHVHRIAQSGKVLKDAFALFDGATTSTQRQVRSATTAIGADLAILAFSVNNVTGGWTTHGLDPSEVAAGTALVVDYLIEQGVDVLLLAGPQRDPSTYSIGYGQGEYDAALRSLVPSRSNVAFMDIADDWGAYSRGNGLGYYQDSVHPKLLGHASIADLVFDAIGGQ